MLKSLFVEDRENRIEAAEDLAYLLNAYTDAVLKFRTDPLLLYGSVTCMRKTVEVIGAYIWYYICYGDRIQSGAQLMRAYSEKKKEKKIIENFSIWETFLNYRDMLVANNDGTDGINFLMHYQTNADRAKEAESLRDGFRIFYRRFFAFKELVTEFFFKIAPEVKSVVSNNTSSLLLLFSGDEAFDKAAMLEKIKEALSKINSFYLNKDSVTDDPWLDWHCYLLNRYEGRASYNLAEADLMATVSRMITERRLCNYLLEKHETIPQINQTNEVNTLNYYLQKVLNLPRKTSTDNIEINNLCDYGRIVGNISNWQIHWFDGEWIHTIPSQMRGITRDIFLQQQAKLFHASSQIVYSSIHDQQPAYAWTWVQKISNRSEAIREELEKEKKKAESENNKLKRAYLEKEQALAKREARISKLENENQKLNDHISSQHAESIKKDDKISYLETETIKKDHDIARKEQIIADLKNKNESMETEQYYLKTQIKIQNEIAEFKADMIGHREERENSLKKDFSGLGKRYPEEIFYLCYLDYVMDFEEDKDEMDSLYSKCSSYLNGEEEAWEEDYIDLKIRLISRYRYDDEMNAEERRLQNRIRRMEALLTVIESHSDSFDPFDDIFNSFKLKEAESAMEEYMFTDQELSLREDTVKQFIDCLKKRTALLRYQTHPKWRKAVDAFLLINNSIDILEMDTLEQEKKLAAVYEQYCRTTKYKLAQLVSKVYLRSSSREEKPELSQEDDDDQKTVFGSGQRDLFDDFSASNEKSMMSDNEGFPEIDFSPFDDFDLDDRNNKDEIDDDVTSLFRKLVEDEFADLGLDDILEEFR